MAKIKKKSPLKAEPLRYPGQSLDENIRDIAIEKIYTKIIMSTFVIVFASYQWYEEISQVPPMPIFWTFIALVVVGYSIVSFILAKKDIENRQLGRDGEREVGRYLELLRKDGYHVFHDLIDENFNVDHVIIGPSGIFTIETKTWRKPEKGQAIVEYDGECLLINGFAPKKNPIVQARAQRDWLQKIIYKTTGREEVVKAVVVFPGWFIKTQKSDNDVWVLEPKALPKYLNMEKRSLSDADIDSIAFQISRYIRTSEQIRKNNI